MDASTARVRLWIAAPVTATPSGKRFLLAPDAFAPELAKATASVKVAVPDRLGDGAQRTFEIPFGKLRVFQLAEVASAVPLLRSLRSLAADIGSIADPAAKVRELVGDGKLARAVADALAGKPPEPASPATPGISVDEVLSGAAVKSSAQSAIDAFMKSSRPASGGSKPSGPKGHAAAAIEEAISSTCQDILSSEPVARLESTWRGLRLLSEQSPESSRIALEILDVLPADALAALEKEMPQEPFERPDAIFIASPVSDADLLRRFAELGESNHVPVVADVPVESALGPGAALGEQLPPPENAPQPWRDLRAEESSRWLCAAMNRVVLLAEPGHVCLGSPAIGVAAMLAQSFRLTEGFGQAIGRAGEIQVPAALKAPGGYQVPTEAYVAAAAQGELASRGLLAFASAKSADRVTLAVAPTARQSPDAMPLPGQIVTGRLVRFAQWVRDELPPGASSTEVTDLFDEAAKVFLFGGASGMGQIRAELVEGEPRAVRIAARLPAAHAGAPFELAFELPLRPQAS